MHRLIHSQTTSTGNTLPWLHTIFRRMIKTKERMYSKVKMSKKRKEWEHYNTRKKETRKALRSVKMELHQQITSPRTQWKQYKILKSTRQENEAVAPLQKDGKRKRDIKNADILNDQLKSVFTLDNENNSSAMERPKYPLNRQPLYKH